MRNGMRIQLVADCYFSRYVVCLVGFALESQQLDLNLDPLDNYLFFLILEARQVLM
jgi:hypothetical protein